MNKHIFHRSGHEEKTVIVVAKSELEAKGKIHDTIFSDLTYIGTVDRIAQESDEDVIDLSNI